MCCNDQNDPDPAGAALRGASFSFMPRAAFIVSSLLFATLLFASSGCRKKSKAGAAGTVSAAFVVDVVAIEPRPFRETLFATGSLVARETVQLQSERAGVVREIRFEEGKPARTGDILVVI